MLKIAPYMIWTAVSVGIYGGLFVPLMTDTINANPTSAGWSDAKKNKNCLLSLVGLGVGEIFGALFLGFV